MADSSSPGHLLLLFIVLVSSCGHRSSAAGADPTSGFVAVELTEDRFKLHKPYDLPPELRYEFRDGVRRLWVYCTDKPLSPGSPTKPRSEILPPQRSINHDLWVILCFSLFVQKTYTSGVWQFEAHAYVPSGTTGVSVMQVFGAPRASGHNTTLMLHVYGGRLMYYHDETRVVDDDICGRWFLLNVVHDVGADELTVFVDGEERLRVAGRGGFRLYFKFGVYVQTDPSHYMESRWRDVKVYTKISSGRRK